MPRRKGPPDTSPLDLPTIEGAGPIEPVTPEWARSAQPRPDLTVSQWADRERVLPQNSAARGARWRTAAVPYMRGIMDAVHEPGTRSIALKKCHQSAGSEGLHNVVGYHIEHDPCPMMFIHPSSTVAEEWSKDRLADLIRSTPALAKVIRERRGANEADSTLSLKVFPGGFLVLGGANTPNTFARWSVRLAIGDDVDRWPAVVGDEGDPADLLENRTTTFPGESLVIYVSTPTLKKGRIDTLFERSDQRRYHVRCPDCGHRDWIAWSDAAHFRVTYTGDDPETARLACPGCGALHDEPARRAMISAAEFTGWRPTATPKEPGLVGFHLPAMVSTLGDVTLPRLVAKWLAANDKGKESLRVFINTSLAEGWEDRGARTDPQSLLSRREDYGAGVEVPARAVAITAGVDVQDNRVEVFVFAWGAAEERWLIDVRVVPGSLKLGETKAALLEGLSRRYTHASGHMLPIHATYIDTGFLADEVYDFVLAHQVRNFFASKGVGGQSGSPIVYRISEIRYGRAARPVRLHLVNVDDAKSQVFSSLAIVSDDDQPRPGRVHFPAHLDAVDEEYFAQLCAEHRETRYNKQGVATHSVWVQDRDRNEALDGAVLAFAAFRRWNPNIRQMLAALGSIPVAAPAGTAATAPAKPKPKKVRPHTTSPYLNR